MLNKSNILHTIGILIISFHFNNRYLFLNKINVTKFYSSNQTIISFIPSKKENYKYNIIH